MTKKKKPRRVMVALPPPAAARIETVQSDLKRRSGHNLTAGETVFVALGVMERMAGKRAYIVDEAAITKIVAQQMAEVVARMIRTMTGRAVMFSTTENGETVFSFADDADKKETVFVPIECTPSLQEVKLN